METLLEFVKVLGLGVVILLLLVIAFAIIDGTINYSKKKKRENTINEEIANIMLEELPDLLKEIAEEENKTTNKKQRKTKGNE